VTMKRHMPVSRGSAHPIKKRNSNVSITLAVKK
jgi:ribosomal protein L22